MRVNALLEKIGIESDDTRIVKGISFDSRTVKEGYIFIAKKGDNYDGNDYIKDAFSNGGICVVSDSYLDANIYKSNDIEKDKDILIKEFYDISDVKLIGVTGTNGKTSTCYLVYDAIKKLDEEALYIGTLGVIGKDYFLELNNTTPEIDILAREIYKAKLNGCKYVVMEVSSHSLSLNRVNILNFDILGFTNFSQDHLDYYKDMDSYFYSKKKLFDTALKDSIAIVNRDDKRSKEIVQDYKGRLIWFGLDEVISNNIKGVKFKEDGITIESKLLFSQNIYNLKMAYYILKSLGFNRECIAKVLNKSSVINGRCEVIESQNYHIILDYAHTPDAMERILKEVNKIKEGRVITLFGCGGNRDKSKRSIMGSIASLYSDFVYLTNDNPRNENEDDIISDIIINMKDNYKIIKDRKTAIGEAINNLEKKDILLILGKGHEEYQIIGNNKYHLSDREIVRECQKK